MDGKFKFSAQGNNLVLFVGSGIKIKIPSEIKQELCTYVFMCKFFSKKFKNSKNFEILLF